MDSSGHQTVSNTTRLSPLAETRQTGFLAELARAARELYPAWHYVDNDSRDKNARRNIH
jgi:hypothetical protein